ncbi:MAG TPA: ABC transporter ATP-binding protein [Anaerolineaceae bacterium]|nr:ABC transporter ATP-binding protein [Anaerolineaceae bacterium]
MENAIEVKGLVKNYGEVKAVCGIDFHVKKGKLFAFLGPNGAGKSTTIDIICTFLQQDAGEVKVGGYTLGKEDAKIREIIGAVFQIGLLDDLLTVEENLRTRGGFYNLKGKELDEAVMRAVEVTGISNLLKRRYGQLSGGQRRRADIARALVHTPEILFLDEPTTGLDPQTRRNVWETIESIKKDKGMTVFMTTHYMEEAANADYVIVIDNGSVVAEGTPSELKDEYSRDKLVLSTDHKAELAARLQKLGFECTQVADSFTIQIASSLAALPILEATKDLIVSFEVLKGTMDDAFITITGKELRE